MHPAKLLLILVLMVTATLVACQDNPDTLEDTGKQPPLDLPPIEINVAPVPSPILKEELFGRWKVTSLDEWDDGDFVIFTDDTTMFAFKCNTMSLTGEMSEDGDWYAPLGRYATTEAGCLGEGGKQDEAILSVMLGPSRIERIGEGSKKLRFSSKDHEMIIERVWVWRDNGNGNGNGDLSQDDLIGGWDIIRFDDFIPQSRLNKDGQPAAYIALYRNHHLPGTLGSRLHIGCNYAGNNTLRLELGPNSPRLVRVPQALDGVETQKGCSPELQKRDGLFFDMMRQSPKLERLGEHVLRLWTDDHELILEKMEIGQERNAIRDFKTIEGKWRVAMANRSGSGFSGHRFAPEPFVISKTKIQYGDETPYIKNPTIRGGKILGEITGDFETRICEDTRFQHTKTERISPDIIVMCYILNTLTQNPVVESIEGPNYIQFSAGDRRITLRRDQTKRNNIVDDTNTIDERIEMQHSSQALIKQRQAEFGVKSPAAVHPSISLDVLPNLTIIAEGNEVCSVTELDVSDFPEIELEKVPGGLNSDAPMDGIFNHGPTPTTVLALFSSLYCDYMQGITNCGVVTDTPIYYHGKNKTIKIEMNNIANLPEIHFSEHDIICRQRYWE